jgi:hypothetical protein
MDNDDHPRKITTMLPILSRKSPFSILSWYPLGFLLVLGLGLALRLTGLEKSIWLDEYITIKIISSQNLVAQLKYLDLEPPLYFMLLKAWSSLGMESDKLRLLSVLLSLGTLVVVMEWLKMYSRLASLLGGLLFATLPVILRFSQELRSYPLLLLGTAISFYFASRVRPLSEKEGSSEHINSDKKSKGIGIPSKYYWGLVIGLVITVLSHTTGVMVVVSVAFFICAQARFNIKKMDITRLLIVFACPVLVFGIIYFTFLSSNPTAAIGSWPYPPVSSELLISAAQTLMGRTGMSYGYSCLEAWIGTLSGLLPWIIKLIVIVMVVLFLMAGKWRQTGSFLAAALFYELTILVYSLVFLPILFSQTLLPMLIPALGFVALQISSMQVKAFRRITATGIFILCLIFALFWFNLQAYIPAEPWQAVATFIKSHADPDDMVIYFPPYNAGPAGYYLDGSAPAGRLLVNFVAMGAPGPHMRFGDDSPQISLSDKATLFQEIDAFAAQRLDPNSPYQIFLVGREEDPFVLEYAVPYENMVSELQEKTGSVPLYTNFNGLSVRIFKVKSQ